MVIKTILLPAVSTNCYVVADEKAGVCAIIDPGDPDPRILNTVAQPRLGEGRLVCQAVETQEDGSVVLNYACLLGGSQVQLWDEGWLAKFVFEGTNLSSFVICLRTYTKTEQTSQALPVRQAAAALSAMGQQGKDLQLSYLDNGSTDMLTTQWTVRERT